MRRQTDDNLPVLPPTHEDISPTSTPSQLNAATINKLCQLLNDAKDLGEVKAILALTKELDTQMEAKEIHQLQIRQENQRSIRLIVSGSNDCYYRYINLCFYFTSSRNTHSNYWSFSTTRYTTS